MRSLATRGSRTELSGAIADVLDVVKVAGFDLIIVETSGIGQGDAEIAKCIRCFHVCDDKRIRCAVPIGKNRYD